MASSPTPTGDPTERPPVRVVVTGATGNVGTSVVDALSTDPGVAAVIGLARRPVTDRGWSPPRTELRVCDVSRDDLDAHLTGADAVVHLAWLFHPTRRPVETWRNNVHGTQRVLESAVRTGVGTCIYLSSIGAYSAAPTGLRATEDWPTDSLPTAAYGREKAYIERLLDVFERDHPQVRVVRFRPSFIFQHPSAVGQRRIFAGPFLPRTPPPDEKRRPLLLPHIPGLRFQALHTDDVAQAVRLALHRPVRGAFNLAADPPVDLRTIARLLGATPVPVPAAVARAGIAALHRLRLVPVPPELFELVLTLPLLDATRARTELGWQPKHDSLNALRELLHGLHDGDGFPTPPLSPATSGTVRWRELISGLGARSEG
jgi:UDP-glucose 4-epimerase